MKAQAEGVELRQEDNEHTCSDPERIKEIEHEILNTWLIRKKGAYWEIGRLLCEARPLYAYKEGFMMWVDKKFGHEFKHRRGYDYMRLYEVCQPKELIYAFPMRFLQKICMKTFNKELREWIFDNREDFNTGLPDDLFDQIVEKVTEDGFDPEDPELKRLLKKREGDLNSQHYFRRIRQHLLRKQSAHDAKVRADEEWFTEAKKALPPDDDGKVKLTRQLKEMRIVGVLEQGGMMPEYELVD